MLALISESTNPYFNLACEEFLLKNFTEDIFFMYRNDASLILGKHQNAFSEVNHRFVDKMKIPVVRRISGGGTVYHDPGNLNFCFITSPVKGNDLVDFKKYTAPIIKALALFGVTAELGSRNELNVEGRKITGTACHVFKGRVLHHGTILYRANLDHLEESISGDLDRYEDKAVKSVRSAVRNLSEKIINAPETDEFMALLFNKIVEATDAELFVISKNRLGEIMALIKEKFSTWDWNYGYSPRFKANVSVEIGGVVSTVTLSVIKGYIQSVESEDLTLDSRIADRLINRAFDPNGYTID